MADATKDPNKSYGWTGTILRVNLTTGDITTESTDPYKDYIGGMGIANKIIYDEVPAGTDPMSAYFLCKTAQRPHITAVPPGSTGPRSGRPGG